MIGGCGSSTPNPKAPFDSDSQKHSADWLPTGHIVAAQEDLSSCAACHGSDFTGGISGVSCTQCHVNVPPFAVTGCISCHGKPPTGTTAPNRSGAHAAHNALLNVTNVCNTCHSGAGTGTLSHTNGIVDLAFLSVYNAKSGTAMRNSNGTCSKVSCHGGQTTPVWQSGMVDVNAQCTACHAYGTTEYNSFSTGKHDIHVNAADITACTVCHDTVKLAVSHFTSLNTTTMEGPASATLNSDLNYDGVSCSPGCHDTRNW